jgi:cytochrome c-type biogenesis protein
MLGFVLTDLLDCPRVKASCIARQVGNVGRRILVSQIAPGTPWLGGALLFLFGLARGVPLLVVGMAAEAIKGVPRLTLWVPKIERASGVLLLIAALYFAYQSAVYAGLAPPLAFSS